MTKRVFIIHGWGGSPKEAMLAWLKSEIEKKGFQVYSPEMPHTEEPTIDDWVNHLENLVGKPDKDTYFIGHSIGCQTIMRYLEKINTKVGGAIFIAGWFTLQGLETKEEEKIASPWLETPLNFTKIKANVNKLTAIFSDNDPFVPLSDKEIFREKLKSKIIVEHDKGHYTGETNIISSQTALNALLEIA